VSDGPGIVGAMFAWQYGMSSGAAGDVAIVKSVYAAFARRDLDAIAAVIAPDAELLGGPTAQVAGIEEPYRGAEGLQRYFADVAGVWDQLSAYPDDFRAASGSVVVFGRLVSTAGDVEVSRDVIWTWRLRDGLIVSLRVSDLS
jgi:ketosteroid isomerase-like protein